MKKLTIEKRVFIIEDDGVNMDMASLALVNSFAKIKMKIEIEKFAHIADARKAIESGGFPTVIVCDNDLGPNNEKGIHFAAWLLKQNYKNFVIWSGSAKTILESNPSYYVIDKLEYGNLIDFVLKGVNA